ncbi:permease prefix domain 2-containing transporter [Runella sp.]|uniref:permease prefix domain 2-containing transporter n=1 Tax=Runella sp. TaxID=1960881 RepID=UPI003D144D8C
MKQNTKPQPPRWAHKLFRLFCARHRVEEMEGDLDELFHQRVETMGLSKARWRYAKDVISLMQPSIIKQEPNEYSTPATTTMLINYFKIAARTLFKNKSYSLIHVTGLSIGLWACLMVASVVLNDLSYDRQWSRKDDMYRIISVNKMGEGLYDRFPSSFAGLAPRLKKDYPEVEHYSELYTADLHLNLGPDKLDNEIKTHALHADTTVWNMLDINVIEGAPQHYKHGTRNLVISRTFKNKYFPNENPIGKIIHDIPVYDEHANPFLITGIMEDLPSNSHLQADVLFLHKGRSEELSPKEFGTFSRNYILLKPGTDIAGFSEKVNSLYGKFTGGKPKYQFEFQSVKDIHLHSDFDKKNKTYGNAKKIYIFSGIALLLLFIACINFINLSTAKAITRLKETGIRKILSASRSQLIMQFLAEAFIVFGIASILAAGIYWVSLRSVEDFLGQRLIKTVISDWSGILSWVGVVIVTCLLTGLYPAWLISGLDPSNTLKGRLLTWTAFGQNQLRRSLVVVQFCISIFVLLALIVVHRQLDFMENRDMGFNKNNLLSIDYISWDGKSDAFKNELLKQSGVTNVSVSQWVPTQGAGFMSKEVEDPADANTKVKVWFISGDLDLAQTLQLKLAKGRLLSAKFAADALNTDSLQSVDWAKYEGVAKLQTSLITASAAKILHIDKLDQQIKNAHTIPVGIVENFNNESLHEPLKPTIIVANRSAQYGGMLVRVTPGAEQSVRNGVRKLWKSFFPAKLLEINRVDDLLAQQYEAEDRLRQFFTFFSGLTLFLSALGIFGLVVQAAEQRAKEIGIRKVLGASVAGIVQLLTGDFVKLVLIALVVISPIALYAMNVWLQDFAYKIEIEWWMFALAGLLAMGIALLTISFQSLKAALTNPVKSLRNE